MTEETGARFPAGEALSPERPLGDEEVVRQIGQWGMVFRRFRRHRLAVASAIVLLFIAAMALVGPFIAPPVHLPSQITFNPALVQPKGPTLQPFSLSRIFGADVYGTPVTTYLLNGAWPTLTICVLGALLAELIGALVGGVAGYFGGIVDASLSRVLDAFFCVPFLPLLMILVGYLPDRNWPYYCLLFGLAGWPGVARLVRGSVLSLREREYAEAARALGGTDGHVIVRHMIPNAIDVVIVSLTLNIAVFILTLANLAYVNGTPQVTLWANALVASGDILNLSWWLIVFPGAAMMLTVLAFNFLGDGLRDAFDITSSGAIEYGTLREPGHLARTMRRLMAPVRGALKPVVAPPPWGRRATLRRSRESSARLTNGPRMGALPMLREQTQVNEGLIQLPGGLLGAVLRAGLPAIVLLGCIAIVLWSHSPLAYAPNFTSLGQVGVSQTTSEYGVAADAHGYRLLFRNATGAVQYERLSTTGSVLDSEIAGPNSGQDPATSIAVSASRPTAPGRGGVALGVWASNDSLSAALFQGATTRRFVLTSAPTALSRPDAIALPGGGFDVLYERDMGNGSENLSLTRIDPQGHVVTTREVVRARHNALFPHGAILGSDQLAMVYLDRAQPGTWHVVFRRFTLSGRSLGHPDILSSATYVAQAPSGQPNPNVVPAQWAIDVERDSTGGVWAAWTADDGASIARWNANGALAVSPALVAPEWLDAPTDLKTLRAIAVAPEASGAILYHGMAGVYSTYLAALRIDNSGVRLDSSPQRINFASGTSAENPRGVTNGNRSIVIWQQARYVNDPLVAAEWHARAVAPDLLTRLGLNLGNPAVNAGFVVVGAIALGLGVAAGNLTVVVLLIVLSFALRRLGTRLPAQSGSLGILMGMTTAYTIAIGVVLVLVYGLSDQPPPWAPVIGGLGVPGRWVAIVGGTFLAWWAGQTVLRHSEPVFRAAGMAFAAVYLVGITWAVMFIQGQITQV